MKRLYFIALLLISASTFAQDTPEIDPKKPIDRDWKFKGILGLNINQNSFVNWAGGGRNSISGTGLADFSYDYKKGTLIWDNDFTFSLGGIFYFGHGGGLQKTDDQIHISSKFGYEFTQKAKGLYLSAFADFRTQFMDGFSYPNDSIRISKFMAPGYLTMGIGFDYSPPKVKGMFISLSPLATKMTFVNDQTLSNAGAYGVDPGSTFRAEFGAYLKFKYETPLGKNVGFKTQWDFFTNYLEPEAKPFTRIDVTGEVMFTFKFNNWFSAFLQFNLIYDHDIDIDTQKDDANGNRIIGPRTQFRQVLGIGLNYKFQNYTDPPKKKK
jgi:hypothetical protein